MNDSYCTGAASLTSCELRLFGGNRTALVLVTSITYSTKTPVLAARWIRWVTVCCSDIFRISSWERKQIAERRHSKAILDNQGRMKLMWGMRGSFEDCARPVHWVAVVLHLPSCLSLCSYGAVAEPLEFLRSKSCKCSHRAGLSPMAQWLPRDTHHPPLGGCCALGFLCDGWQISLLVSLGSIWLWRF